MIAKMHHQRKVTRARYKPRFTHQRKIKRGGGDTGGAAPGPPTITAVAPATHAASATDVTFTATGTNIVAPVEVFYAGVGASGQVVATVVSATSFTFVLPTASIATPITVVWNADIGPDVVTVDGPNITIT